MKLWTLCEAKMLGKILVTVALTFSANAFADECATRVITDKIYDSQGAELVSEQSRTSCGNGGSNLNALVGIDDHCYYFDTPGGRQLACQYPNGNWVAFGDIPVEAIDSFARSEDAPQSGRYSTRQDYQTNPSFLTMFLNFTKWWQGSLSSESKVLHDKAIYFAVQHSKNGELVTWRNKQGTEQGRIKVVSTMPVSGGFCRRMLVELSVGNSIRNLNETACLNINTNQWHFIQ